MLKISIIIPVYNAELYIEECLKSLISQTLSDIEIICVNDGSTDSTLLILEKFAQNDNRIIIHSQPNSGQGKARNYGIEIAKGEYISFVDADDFIDKGFCEKMYNRAKEDNTEITMCCVQLYDNKTGQNIPDDDIWILKNLIDYGFKDKCFSFEDTKQFYFDKLLGIPCNKIFKTDFLHKYNLKFPENVKAEDYPFFYDYWIKAKKANVCYEKLYFYRRNNDFSDTASGAGTYGYSFFSHFDSIERTIKNAGYWNELKIPFLEKKISGFSYLYNRTPKANRKEFFNRISNLYKEMNLSQETLNSLGYTYVKQYYAFLRHSYFYYENVQKCIDKVFEISIVKKINKILGRIFTFRFEHQDGFVWIQFFGIKMKVRK